MHALWEHLNQAKWQKAKDTDREYVSEVFLCEGEKGGDECGFGRGKV